MPWDYLHQSLYALHLAFRGSIVSNEESVGNIRENIYNIYVPAGKAHAFRVTNDGWFLVNNHVIKLAKLPKLSIEDALLNPITDAKHVLIRNNQILTYSLVDTLIDEQHDIAIIKASEICDPSSVLPVKMLVGDPSIKIGEEIDVYHLSNSNGNDATTTTARFVKNIKEGLIILDGERHPGWSGSVYVSNYRYQGIHCMGSSSDLEGTPYTKVKALIENALLPYSFNLADEIEAVDL
jgi:hypothetical protein